MQSEAKPESSLANDARPLGSRTGAQGSDERFDAVIVGAGPAGATAALALAAQGRSVAIIEKAAFPRRKVCGEFMSATSVPVLASLGLAEAFSKRAGPPVRRLALFAGERVVEAPMPVGEEAVGASTNGGFGRALGRDVLDEMMLERAAASGVRVIQPARAKAFGRDGEDHLVDVDGEAGEVRLRTKVLIAAHGSWERGPLPTQSAKTNDPADLFGFKAHFRGAMLPEGVMPLLAFPGGYGGMVEADGGRVSISLCLRRDVLEREREARGNAGGKASASDAARDHVIASCRGVREALAGAEPCGAWLATGPVRPGMRPCYADDIFRVGNVAGESHSIIAEGISMGIQSSWLLARALSGRDWDDPEERAAAGAAYGEAWREQFAGRIRAASAYSKIAMNTRAASPIAALIETFPRTLTLGARLSGKTKPVAIGSTAPLARAA